MTRGALLALLLAATALAGCSDGKAAKKEGEAVTIDGHLVGAGLGLIDGLVVSDAGLPVPDARVSILGSDNYTDTARDGTFRFLNVTPGEVELQAVHTAFQAHVHRATVAPGVRTQVNVTLLPKGGAGNELPHLHDHWAGQETYLLFDGTIDLQRPPPGSPYPDQYWTVHSAVVKPNYAASDAANWFIPLTQTPHGGPALVLPGTDKLTFTLTWSGETIRTDGFKACYRSAANLPVQCLPVQARSPATWEIDVTPEMADSGHQPYTLWSLWFMTDQITTASGTTPDVTYGSVQAKVELTKGEVLVDPPHPTFWANGSELIVMEKTENRATISTSPASLWYPEGIVPPGTGTVRIEHSWFIDGAAGSAPYEWRVAFRDASIAPDVPQGEWTQPTPTAGSVAEKRFVYDIEVSPLMTDGYYQHRSYWRFVAFQPSSGADGPDITGVAVRHTMKVTALKG